jgi:hypothetical protein
MSLGHGMADRAWNTGEVKSAGAVRVDREVVEASNEYADFTK